MLDKSNPHTLQSTVQCHGNSEKSDRHFMDLVIWPTCIRLNDIQFDGIVPDNDKILI